MFILPYVLGISTRGLRGLRRGAAGKTRLFSVTRVQSHPYRSVRLVQTLPKGNRSHSPGPRRAFSRRDLWCSTRSLGPRTRVYEDRVEPGGRLIVRKK